MKSHSVEKIGGTSMSDYRLVRDNVILNSKLKTVYQRIFVVSAYGGMTDELLEHKKNGQEGIYGLFAGSIDSDDWIDKLEFVKQKMLSINAELFVDDIQKSQADEFVHERFCKTKQCLLDLQRVCQHGHFSLADHLQTVREMLASLGEAHSAWNTAHLLQNDGVNAVFVDLTAWDDSEHISLDGRIVKSLAGIDLETQLPIVTGYAHSEAGLMSTFDRGYSEMTFSRVAVITQAKEAIIHKEFHLSSADPRLVGERKAVPIGRTNYDVADQLANLGMEAIHPKAAKGLRQNDIPLRVKNTFEPEHQGTLITSDYVSDEACVEIIAGCKGVYAIELFDQDMANEIGVFEQKILATLLRFKAHIISQDINANTITYYLRTNLKTVKRIQQALAESFKDADINQRKVAIVSAIGSDMQVPGILAKAVCALSDSNISILAIHQAMRQVDMQFVLDETDYDAAVASLHRCLVEVHDHGAAICLAS